MVARHLGFKLGLNSPTPGLSTAKCTQVRIFACDVFWYTCTYAERKLLSCIRRLGLCNVRRVCAMFVTHLGGEYSPCRTSIVVAVKASFSMDGWVVICQNMTANRHSISFHVCHIYTQVNFIWHAQYHATCPLMQCTKLTSGTSVYLHIEALCGITGNRYGTVEGPCCVTLRVAVENHSSRILSSSSLVW